MEILDGEQLAEALGAAGVQAWDVDHGRLKRQFVFADFSEAWGFLSRVALLAERHNHHPDLANSWNCVSIELTTHDAGGVTQRDVDLAAAIDAVVGNSSD